MPRIVLLAALALVACDTTYGYEPAPVADAEAWDAMLDAVNEVRARGGTCDGERMAPTTPLVWDARLERAAQRHTRDMARFGYFDHVGRDGSDVGDRARGEGYAWRAVGENIARGQRSVDQVLADWLASPGHCLQIHSPRFVEIGAAEENGYWTQVFGVPR